MLLYMVNPVASRWVGGIQGRDGGYKRMVVVGRVKGRVSS